MTTAASSEGFLHIVMGYDGSPPATRALDAAVRLLQGRAGHIEVVWVSHLSSTVMLSADAIAEMEAGFTELEPELRTQASEQLRGLEVDWRFERLQGIISDELIAVAAARHEAHPGQTVVIVVGSSSRAGHRVVGSVPVSLARHSPARCRCCRPSPSGVLPLNSISGALMLLARHRWSIDAVRPQAVRRAARARSGCPRDR